MSPPSFPIETRRLLIRPLRIEDAEELHELYSDAEAMRFLSAEVPATIAESRAWVQAKIDKFLAEDGMSLWAVVERRSGRVIGDAGLQWEEIAGSRELELACRILARFQGRGYGTEASEACLRAAFDAGVTRVVAQTDAGNAAAARVLRRVGMICAGRLAWQGRTMDLYEITRSGAGRRGADAE